MSLIFSVILYNFEENQKNSLEIFKIYIEVNEIQKNILFILSLLSSIYINNKKMFSNYTFFLSHSYLLDFIILNLIIDHSINNYIDLFLNKVIC